MKKPVLLFLLTLFIIALFGCESPVHKKLAEADDFIIKMENDSASSILNSIDTSGQHLSDKIYYEFLRLIISYRKYEQMDYVSAINRITEYYEKHGSKDELARAYLYKGQIVEEVEGLNSGLLYLKKAEHIAQSLYLKRDIATELIYFNSQAKNYKLSKKYAYQGLMLSKQTGSKKWAGLCYYYLLRAYMDEKKEDSLNIVVKGVEDNIHLQPAEEADIQYFYLAKYYYDRNNREKAKSLLLYAINLHPYEPLYYFLAIIYSEEGNQKMAERMWNKALNETQPYLRAPLLEKYAVWLNEQGQSEKAKAIAEEARILKDTVEYQQQITQEESYKIQSNYDNVMKAEKNTKRWGMMTLLISFLVVVIVVIMIVYSKFKKKTYMSFSAMKSKNEEYLSKLKILEYENKENERAKNNYIRQIEELNKTVSEDKDKQIDLLQDQISILKQTISEKNKKIEEIRKDSDEITDKIKNTITKGGVLYNSINEGKTTLKWNKNDYETCTEYIRMKNPDLVAEIENKYKGVSSRVKFFLIIEASGMNKLKIKNLLGLSDGAYRTMKSRATKNR